MLKVNLVKKLSYLMLLFFIHGVVVAKENKGELYKSSVGEWLNIEEVKFMYVGAMKVKLLVQSAEREIIRYSFKYIHNGITSYHDWNRGFPGDEPSPHFSIKVKRRTFLDVNVVEIDDSSVKMSVFKATRGAEYDNEVLVSAGLIYEYPEFDLSLVNSEFKAIKYSEEDKRKYASDSLEKMRSHYKESGLPLPKDIEDFIEKSLENVQDFVCTFEVLVGSSNQQMTLQTTKPSGEFKINGLQRFSIHLTNTMEISPDSKVKKVGVKVDRLR